MLLGRSLGSVFPKVLLLSRLHFAENMMGDKLRRNGFVLSSLPTASAVITLSISLVRILISTLPFSRGQSHHFYLLLSSGEFISLDLTSSSFGSRQGVRRAKGGFI